MKQFGSFITCKKWIGHSSKLITKTLKQEFGVILAPS